MFGVIADAAQATANSPYQIRMPAALVTAIVGGLLPLLVALVTKINAHSALKATLLALFSAVTGLIVQATIDDGTAVLSAQGFALAFGAFASGVIAYFGLWRAGNAPAKLAPTVGLGGDAPPRRVVA